MHRVLYVGDRFDPFFSQLNIRDLSICQSTSHSLSNKDLDEIIVIDGAAFNESPLAYASHIKSRQQSPEKVWLYVQHPEMYESIEACYKEGFDDVVDSHDVNKLETSLIKASLLFGQRSHYLEQLGMAQSMARTALCNSGELGTLVHLFNKHGKNRGLYGFWCFFIGLV